MIFKDIDPIHAEILEKFLVFKGRVIKGGREFGANKFPLIPRDEIVSARHRLHNLVRGVYVNQADGLAQAIHTNPESKWGKEIVYEDDDHWALTYDFGKKYKFPSNIVSLRRCYEKNVPFGVILRLKHGVNKILGLGKISKVRGTRFTIVPYVSSEKIEQKTEEKAYEYVKARHERKDYSSNVKERTVLARSSQRWFREELLAEYRKCVFCGMSKPGYLVGSHIVPHHIMQKQDPKNAMNPKDGLLMCRLCDVAFEKNDILVLTNLQIRISDKLRGLATQDKAIKNWLSGVGKKLKIKANGRYKPGKKFLSWKLKIKEKNYVELMTHSIPH